MALNAAFSVASPRLRWGAQSRRTRFSLSSAVLDPVAVPASSDATRVRARLVLVTAPDALCALSPLLFFSLVYTTLAAPYAEPAPYGGRHAVWSAALQHVAKRIEWQEPTFRAETFLVGDVNLRAALADADVVVCVGIREAGASATLVELAAFAPCVFAFDSCPTLSSASRLHFQPATELMASLASALPWTRVNRDALLLETAKELFDRHTPSDLLFSILLLVDSAVAPVGTLVKPRSTSFGTLACMVQHCAKEVVGCVTDTQCKAALDCLTACGLNDQVCSYRCLVSYECQQFEAFSLCVLQKHNCLGNAATRPLAPALPVMATFRGEPLTHDIAERLLFGWLSVGGSLVPESQRGDVSWLVVAGANPAYDYFPSQHQLYYRKGREVWYDPVFRVETLGGEFVWRRRHYRVRRDAEPGRFLYSVLDNGVTSLEHWAVVDVADDLSWGLFAYSGAATRAGQSYGGAVFVTPNGLWPTDAEQLARIKAAHEACGIRLWELVTVDNTNREGAPLALDAKL